MPEELVWYTALEVGIDVGADDEGGGGFVLPPGTPGKLVTGAGNTLVQSVILLMLKTPSKLIRK
jgi:hypothetical protein